MKNDLATAILAAIVGVAVSYIALSMLILKDPEPVVVKGLNEATSIDLAEPSVDVFNYRSINPTVETYVDCTNYDASGSCINEGQ
ncbi:hypothetical protein IKF23_00430 [Candidatus Saccharibacteria bacterium]|nr:hypothetical protein [Candidatus Saccharibacteria bacterium]